MKPSLRLAPTLAALPLLAGCRGGTPAATPRHPRADPDPAILLAPARPLPRVTVRLAPDRRAAVSPTLYRADGTVTTLHALVYDASLELAIRRALTEAAPETYGLPAADATAELFIHDFCVDERTADHTPVARITLSRRVRAAQTPANAAPTRLHTATEPLPPGATPTQIRDALARCLRTAALAAAKAD